MFWPDIFPSLRACLRQAWQSLMKIEIAKFIPSDVIEIASLALAMAWLTGYLQEKIHMGSNSYLARD